MHRTLQVLWSSALRLSCLHKRLVLLSEAEDLKIEQPVPSELGPMHLQGNCKVLIRAHPERIGDWLGRTLAHCLLHQGPYCAALLLKVWSATGSYMLCDSDEEVLAGSRIMLNRPQAAIWAMPSC